MYQGADTCQNTIDENGFLRSRLPDFQESEIPKVQGSLYLMMDASYKATLKKNGDWVLYNNGINKDVIMGSEMDGHIKRFVVALKELGFKQGDGIHLVVGNHNFTTVILMAAWRLGGVTSCGDPSLNAEAISSQVKDMKPSILVCVPETADTMKLTATNSNAILVSLGSVAGCQDLLELANRANTLNAPEPVNCKDINDIVNIFWSSGTTGRSKGICYSHSSMWNMLCRNQGTEHLTNIITTVFFHIGGQLSVLRAICHGTTIIHFFGQEFTLDLLLHTAKAAPKAACIVLGTHHYVTLSEYNLEGTDFKSEDFENISLLFPVGASVPSICEKKIKHIFPNIQVVYHYGSTELGAVSHGICNEHLGDIMRNSKIKLVKPDTLQLARVGELGEIRVKNIYRGMTRYINSPDSKFYDEDGFGSTGDLGFYDTNGRLYYVERIKELIKYKNNHIAPTEIEEILQEHPAVKECLVFGASNPRVQELVSAVIVPVEGIQFTEEELREFANSKVTADYKKIRGEILVRNNIPRNNAGKLLRRVIREWYHSQAIRNKIMNEEEPTSSGTL